jgi:hypothetical protein
VSWRDNFVKRRKHNKPLAKGTGGINPCFRPAGGASKADLREFHDEDLKLRRSRQLARVPNVYQSRSTSIASGNRHGGAHRHEREIARAAKRGDQ